MDNTHTTDADVIIVGGGLAGLTQALLLGQNNLSVICVDKAPLLSTDARTTAISYGSHKVLSQAGIWDDLLPHSCPIEDIQILDGSSPVLLDFPINDVQKEMGANAFGWIIENHVIRKALTDAIQKQKSIKYIQDTGVKKFDVQENFVLVTLDNGKSHSAKLVIGADGRQSFTREWMGVGTREWSYNQRAIVTIVQHEKPHNNIAVEHFRDEGPFAILPMLDDRDGNHRSSIVWTEHAENNARAMQYDEKTFLAALNTRFPDFYGEVFKTEKRYAYPLNFVHAYQYTAPRMVLIADAAHGIHPIAGQGLNLGLRDVAALENILKDVFNNKNDIGSGEVLNRYQKERQKDNVAMAAATDLLNKIFSNSIPPIRLARKIGLKIVNNIEPAKKFFMHQAMGLAGKKSA